MNISTNIIHAGQEPDEETGAIIPPLYQTSTYAQESPGVFKGYDYTRAGNPTFTRFEHAIAAAEHASYATAFSSGLGATNALLSTLQSGDTVLAGTDLYGGTYRLLTKCYAQFGIHLVQVDTTNIEKVEEACRVHKPQLLFIESPSNPLLSISDIEALATIARDHNVTSVVDNTFASPFFQQPLKLGADAVLHSTSKYIGGHSDIIGGVIATNSEALKQKMDFARMALGLNPSPFDVWLAHRGLKTLAVRMQRHEENATHIAQWLHDHPLVSRVYYPGLSDHPHHIIAARQMSGYSGIVSAEFHLSYEQMTKLISSFSLFILAESLGGVESLVDHPASMTHASIPREEREKHGLLDGLVRFSVGIEDAEDLKSDIERSLISIDSPTPKR